MAAVRFGALHLTSRHGCVQSEPWYDFRPWARTETEEDAMRKRTIGWVCGLVLAGGFPSAPEVRGGSIDDLIALDLEALNDVRVTLASRHPEPHLTAPAALYVIRREDLLRSGVTTIPDALRMVPGLQVAQMEANKWAITSRGFDSRFARYMLVQVDGRTVYTPLFSGVFWEMQDILFADVEQIEVVRGPGGALWGANAVNGIINIVTRRAKDTQGVWMEAGGGTEERAFAAVRVGVKAAPDTYVRVYAKGSERDAGEIPGETAAEDDWRNVQAGFRVDWEQGAHDHITLQGDTYDGSAGQRLLVPDFAGPYWLAERASFSGANLLLNWTHGTGAGGEWKLTAYVDQTRRSEFTFDEERLTWDADVQNRVVALPRQDLVWGLGYRATRDRLGLSPLQTFSDYTREDNLYSAFAQDTIRLTPECLSLILGSKVEHNDYTGWEFQPNVRLVCAPDKRQAWWAAVSRAVRTPSRAEHTMRLERLLSRPGMTFFGQDVLPLVVTGDDSYKSERAIACELGHRVQPVPSFALDATLFYNDYDRIQSLEAAGMEIPVPFVLRNKIEGHAYGAELAADWRPVDDWKLRAAYAYLNLNLRTDADSLDIFTVPTWENDVPHNQASLQSRMNLPAGFQFDQWLRYVDPVDVEGLPSYLELDLRLACRLTKAVELAVVGRNLLHSHHREYGPSFLLTTESTEVERSVYGRLTWQF
jgi:iron complex outermembrane receptor protein